MHPSIAIVHQTPPPGVSTLHISIWFLGVVLVPALPIGAAYLAAWFAGGTTGFWSYVVDVVQDGQLFFYSVATGCGQGIEAWEWHGAHLYTPYRGVIAIAAVMVVTASIFFYGMIAAVRQTGAAGPTPDRKLPIACFSIAFAVVSAILVTCSHVWIKQHGG